MAIYHLKVTVGSRKKGQSAITAAAYRSGSKIYENETGLTSDYTRKHGVIYGEVALCENAPSEYKNREVLWNAVQKVETAKDARLWREIEVALPYEFSIEQRIEVVRKFVAQLTAQGMCADWSMHDPDKEIKNPHAHIMLTTRSILPNGEWAAKSKKVYDLDENGEKIPLIDKKTGKQKVDKNGRKQWKNHKEDYNNWNENERVEEWRTLWEEVCNEYLSEENKIDHRSFERQGKIDVLPTIHEGYVARAMEQRGEVSERMEINRVRRAYNKVNQEITQTAARLNANVAEAREIAKELSKLSGKTEKEKVVAPIPLEEYANNILAARNRYFADSINLSVKNRAYRDTDYSKLHMKSKADKAEVAVKALPRFAEKVRNLAEKIKSLSFFKRKEKLQLTDERATAVDELKKNMAPIIEIGVGKDYDCENPTENSTNSVCIKANEKIKQIRTEAAAEQKKVDFVEKLSDITEQIVAEDLERLKAVAIDTASKLTAQKRSQLATMINKPYKPTGNNRVPFKTETAYTELIRRLMPEALGKQAQERTQQLPKKRKGQSR